VPIAIFTNWVRSSGAEFAVAEVVSAFGVVAANACAPKKRDRGRADRAVMNLRRDIIVILFRRT
jgi:hypothetical protein